MPQNGPVPTILVEFPGGEGVVRGDDGEMVITRDVRDGRGLARQDLGVAARRSVAEQRRAQTIHVEHPRLGEARQDVALLTRDPRGGESRRSHRRIVLDVGVSR